VPRSVRPCRGSASRPIEEEAATSILQAIVLGLVQGLTEFIPVSSSGHLILVPWLLHWSILTDESLNKTFDVALHMGTFLGAVAYFWRDIVRYLGAWFRSIAHRGVRDVDERLAWCLVIGTIPGAIAGAAFEGVIERRLGAPWLIAVMLAAFGVLLWVVDRRAPRARAMADIRMQDAVLIGLAQAVALQPGVSRAGVTITAARGRGLDRETAARFSFLLSLPIIGGAGLFKGLELLTGSEHIPPGFGGAFLWGFVASAVSGFLVIGFLLAYLRRRDFTPFVVYRLLAAAFVLAIIAAGLRPATVERTPVRPETRAPVVTRAAAASAPAR
jgi:undecaprenyl-diphosphatase